MVDHTRTPTAQNGGFCAVLEGSGGGFSWSLHGFSACAVSVFSADTIRILCGSPHKRRMVIKLTPSVGFFGQKLG